jgi:transcriptional regulator with XRE-family HTH domain
MKISTSQERLNELFSSDPRSDSAIATELGVSKQALSSWRKGIRSPKKSVLIAIADMYHVGIDWLMGFDVPKEKETTVIPIEVKTEEARFVSMAMDKMPPEYREKAVNVLKAMYGEYFAETEDKIG